MTWNLLIGPACLLLGILITLYVKDSARGVAKNEFREQIGAALAVFKLDLIESLDRRYRVSNECLLMMSNIDNRMDIQDNQEQKDINRDRKSTRLNSSHLG